MLKRFTLVAALFAFTLALPAQTNSAPPQNVPANNTAPATKTRAPKAPVQEAPGGGPDKVWVNTNSSTYHCPGDRFYGKTAHGRYMTEPAAKASGAHGVGGKTCFTGK